MIVINTQTNEQTKKKCWKRPKGGGGGGARTAASDTRLNRKSLGPSPSSISQASSVSGPELYELDETMLSGRTGTSNSFNKQEKKKEKKKQPKTYLFLFLFLLLLMPRGTDERISKNLKH